MESPADRQEDGEGQALALECAQSAQARRLLRT